MSLTWTKQDEGGRVSGKTTYQGYEIELVAGWFFQRDAWQAFAKVTKGGEATRINSSLFCATSDAALSDMADHVQRAIDADKV